ncbi:MAG TPA: GNAT family N-acetyltransferase [Roseiflexaceae bacterium]|nr:GNAT family N-acetyltransferase [Roseiflexaceae bacterium]
MLTIESLDAGRARALLPALAGLLRDSVEAGASIGFMLPLPEEAVEAYWRKVIDDLPDGRVLLLARLDGRVVGAAQLALERRQNGAHRAEVQKVLVHTSARRRGVGRALMDALEREARARGRTLLVLDTRADDPAERLYLAAGYTLAGRIPGYARSPDGTLDDTTIFYRRLSVED